MDTLQAFLLFFGETKGKVLVDNNGEEWILGDELLGYGGFGVVIIAKKYGEYKYAVKLSLRPESIAAEANFFEEIASRKNIQSHLIKNGLDALGIPAFYGSGCFESVFNFIVMKLYKETLDQASKNRPLPKATLYRLAKQLIDVLKFLHSNHMVHYDIKAENILVGGALAYLTDYGGITKAFSSNHLFITEYYASRDACKCKFTFRGDIESLLYNLLKWCGFELPWKAMDAEAKADFLQCKNLAVLNDNNVPLPLQSLFQYVVHMQERTYPDHDGIKRYFEKALGDEGLADFGDFKFN